jgi:hypothetical protein
LRNLSPLEYDKKIKKPKPTYVSKNGKKLYFAESLSGTNNAQHHRSKFWPGIAKAMAEQWG